jgi:prepilin peptidase dependent protein B
MRARQRGLSLVELMIGITLGVLLLLAGTSMYLGTVSANAELLKTAKLDQDLHAAMDLMLRDLRRAGATGDPNASNPFTLDAAAAYSGQPANSCITFTYDLNQNGALDTGTPDERFGFRLKGQAVELRRNGLACTADGWEAVTDPMVVRVTALQFSVTQETTSGVGVRSIQVTLSGQLPSDSTISRSLVRVVKVRNDAYTP